MTPFDELDAQRPKRLASWAVIIALVTMVALAGLAAMTGGRTRLDDRACAQAAANLATGQTTDVMDLRSVNQDCPRSIG